MTFYEHVLSYCCGVIDERGFPRMLSAGTAARAYLRDTLGYGEMSKATVENVRWISSVTKFTISRIRYGDKEEERCVTNRYK